jgi:hypothetical protein
MIAPYVSEILEYRKHLPVTVPQCHALLILLKQRKSLFEEQCRDVMYRLIEEKQMALQKIRLLEVIHLGLYFTQGPTPWWRFVDQVESEILF